MFDWVVNVGEQLCELLELMHRQNPPLLFTRRLDHLYLNTDQQTVKVLPELSANFTWVKYRLVHLRERLQGIGVRMVRSILDEPLERIVGLREPRSDLFALAGVLYGWLTYRTAEGTYTQRQILEGFAAIPADERWLFELIAINLSQDVGDRYSSARAIHADLSRRAVTRQR